MDFLTNHPITIGLALVSAVLWGAGKRNGNKRLVAVGIALSAAATVTFILRL